MVGVPCFGGSPWGAQAWWVAEHSEGALRSLGGVRFYMGCLGSVCGALSQGAMARCQVPGARLAAVGACRRCGCAQGAWGRRLAGARRYRRLRGNCVQV